MAHSYAIWGHGWQSESRSNDTQWKPYAMNDPSNSESLSRYSGEFASASGESAFLWFTWNEHKTVTRYTLLVIAFMGAAFLIGDLMDVRGRQQLHYLFPLRLAAVCSLMVTARIIHRTGIYFDRYHHLLLFNQIFIAISIFLLAVIRQMPVAHLGVNTILFTLIYYQFINNRYGFTILACSFLCVGSVLTGHFFLDMSPTEFIAALLFLVPLNFLGIMILGSIKRTRRREYVALMQSREHNAEKERLIGELQAALAEVKTLQGFLPICAKCHKIRNDKGFWEGIEKYIQDRTEAQFSHGICPECAGELYPEFIKKE